MQVLPSRRWFRRILRVQQRADLCSLGCGLLVAVLTDVPHTEAVEPGHVGGGKELRDHDQRWAIRPAGRLHGLIDALMHRGEVLRELLAAWVLTGVGESLRGSATTILALLDVQLDDTSWLEMDPAERR